MQASNKNNSISYKKMNVVAALVRRKPVIEALSFLQFAPKKAARILAKIISSAVANAEQKDAKKENLIIDEIKVTKGSLYKRWRPGARGRSLPYRKAMSNCAVKLSNISLNAAKVKEEPIDHEDKATNKKNVKPKDSLKKLNSSK
ncbi:MAG: uL22 family ribosomal protein [Patescibacteria group bacterium]|nr:uL22 family ribosomal protein [Patescibacteria group bacterium]